MNKNIYEINNAKIRKIVKNLCKDKKDEEEIRGIVNGFSEIYKNPDFRHSYANITGLILEISNDHSLTDGMFSYLQILEGNMTMVVTYVNENQISEVKNIMKLYDHILLEILRINYQSEVIKSVEIVTADIATISKKSTELTEDIDDAKKALDKSQISAITVIGLFSAITMSFFGGISFSQQALEALKLSSPIRLVFVLSLTGFILFNLLFLILYIIGKLTSKPICSRCINSTDENKKVCTCKNKPLWCRMVKRYPYVLWANSVLLFLMTDMALIWMSTLFFNKNLNPICVVSITSGLAILAIIILICIKSSIKKSSNKNKR